MNLLVVGAHGTFETAEPSMVMTRTLQYRDLPPTIVVDPRLEAAGSI